jgi:hypothetical protein
MYRHDGAHLKAEIDDLIAQGTVAEDRSAAT